MAAASETSGARGKRVAFGAHRKNSLHAVFFVHENNRRLVRIEFGVFDFDERHNDEQIAAEAESCGGAVHFDRSAARLAFDGVGLETLSVIQVDDLDPLVRPNVGLPEQIGVDRDRSDVIQVRSGRDAAMDLGMEHETFHSDILSA